MVNGFINLLKPPGPTSHDMVAFVRRLLGIKKVGHAGTLDPLAAGVLVIAVGKATRLISYLEGTKTYRGEITFGKTTSTLDAGGEIQSVSPVSLELRQLKDVMPQFTGSFMQVPPMVSAIKWRGQRLYNLARQGLEIERKPRPVNIHELKLLSFEPDTVHPRALFECTCSAGTYMRSLAADIGKALSCGAYLSFLLRTQSGPFTIDTSITPSELEEAIVNGCLDKYLLPPEKGVTYLTAINLSPEDELLFSHGNFVILKSTKWAKNTAVRVHNHNGAFLGIGQLNISGTEIRLNPDVVFN
ncbi:MAG: tRNA pseudouridine(55) synthase TruB [Firmicutes bacterium]|nr:tRNA pseudouridine(55) synthase TruB [Bacillota bacterium]